MNSITKRGLWNTLGLLLPEVLFDLRHGTDTFKLVSNAELTDVTSQSKTFGGPYQGANPKLFRTVFQKLRRDFLGKKDFSQETFIDYGCGKGRTLIMAAELGFRRAIGVEYSAQLCDTARKNTELFKGKSRSSATIEVVHADAKEYAVPADATVFFFFNPFGPEILDPVLKSVASSLKSSPRAAFLLYMNPQHPKVFESNGFTQMFTWGAQNEVPDAILYSQKLARNSKESTA